MTDVKKINDLVAKVAELKKNNKFDLSSGEDLSLAIMNLVSIEEHLFFTGAKLKKTKYFDLLNSIRKMRVELLRSFKMDHEGETWCISKHLLAASMRLMEVGTKELAKGEKQKAYRLFAKAYDLYSLFWGINLKLVNMSGIKEIDEEKLDVHDEDKNTVFGKLGEIVKRLVDCCKE